IEYLNGAEQAIPIVALLDSALAPETEKGVVSAGADVALREPSTIRDLLLGIERAQERRNRLSGLHSRQAVFEAMKQIGSELEIENLIPSVFSQLQRLFPCRRVRMFIFDSSASRIVQGFRSSSDQEGNTTAESFETSGGASEIFIDRSDGNVDE